MNRGPRVAFFTDSFHEVNGVALTSRQFARFARERFYPFFSVHAGPARQYLKRGSFETYELESSQVSFGLEHDLKFDLLFARHALRLQSALKRFWPDLIHITGPGHLPMLGAILAHRLGVPLVASWHTNVHEFGSRRLAKLLRRWLESVRSAVATAAERTSLNLTLQYYRLAKMTFAPNPELCSLLRNSCNRPVYPMERGVDCDLFTPSRCNASADRFVIGYVGRISTEKNVRVLAEVERQLESAGVSGYEFCVVGEGSERPWLEANLSRARFTGVLKDEALANAYANMDVLLFPSETDTFGNVVLEASASGVPSVVSALGGPKYLVEDGETGYVAEGAQGFARPILRMMGDRQLRGALGAAARKSALTRSWSAVFDGVYERCRRGIDEGVLRPRDLGGRRTTRPLATESA